MDAHDLRIGDAERERTMASLREHFAQGRLNHEELDERLDRTLAARTARDLTAITADLPSTEYGYAPPTPAKDGAWDDRHAYQEMMRAHRHQMKQARHQMHEAHRQWHETRHRTRHQGPARRHHGPPPFVPFLLVFGLIALIVGGFGALKFVLFIAIGAMIFSAIRRAAIRRSLR
ncbi:DUF1707 domain-containing protein [Nonomuraea sp. NPDC050790]|uniref:DUF1707 domain-containing protein n=1 Tax=Nonomuraea sp. NPDC050790 TaxID=3364371 RepID=UPI0037B23FB5